MKKLLKICLIILMVVSGTNTFAQIKVSTPYNELEVKVLRCAVINDNCVIDMLFENTGESDIELNSSVSRNRAYDDMGNEYNTNQENKILLYVGDMKTPISVFDKKLNFLSDVPIKVRTELKNVSEIATTVKRLDLYFWIPTDINPRVIKLSNIPISRAN